MRLGDLLDETFPKAPSSLCVPPPMFWRKPGLKFVPGGVILSPSVAPCVKSASEAVLVSVSSRMQLTLHATRRTSRLALDANSVCLVGENPKCSAPAL